MAKKILLADDSVTIQKVVELTFMDEDYEVVATSDGSSALEKLPEVGPDLVIADVHMPQTDGYEVCRQTKQNHPGIPVLLLVGTFEQFDEDKASAVGADGHLKKPFDSQDLLNQVEALIAKTEAVPAVAEASFEPSTFGEAAGSSELEPPTLMDEELSPVSAGVVETRPTAARSWGDPIESVPEVEAAEESVFEMEGIVPETVMPVAEVAAAAAETVATETVATETVATETVVADTVAEPEAPVSLFETSADGFKVPPDVLEEVAEARASEVPAVDEVVEPSVVDSRFGIDAAPAADVDAPDGSLEDTKRIETPSVDDLEAPALESSAVMESVDPVAAPLAADTVFDIDAAADTSHVAPSDEVESADAAELQAVDTAAVDTAAVETGAADTAAADTAAASAVAVDVASENGSRSLSDEDVERIAKRVAEIMGEKALREVAWEVIPDLAEVLIKERIRELESQVE